MRATRIACAALQSLTISSRHPVGQARPPDATQYGHVDRVVSTCPVIFAACSSPEKRRVLCIFELFYAYVLEAQTPIERSIDLKQSASATCRSSLLNFPDAISSPSAVRSVRVSSTCVQALSPRRSRSAWRTTTSAAPHSRGVHNRKSIEHSGCYTRDPERCGRLLRRQTLLCIEQKLQLFRGLVRLRTCRSRCLARALKR